MTTRAMAQSAVAAGLLVSSIDAFGDLDHPHSAGLFGPASGNGSSWRVQQLPWIASSVAPGAEAVAYGASLENHPSIVAALARGRTLWGNSPGVLRRVRDPRALSQALRRAGCHAPDVRLSGDARPDDAAEAWLLKPRRSGGGHLVRPWQRAARVPRSCYAQRRIEGVPGSVLFVASRAGVAVVGITRQIVGDPAFGVGGFRYCGSILCAAGDHPGWAGPAARVARAVGAAFDLVGVGGVDFIGRDGVVHPIEVNPRWTSSMELAERACGRSLFGAHVDACTSGALPSTDGTGFVARPGRALGKAIVFARRDVRVGDTRRWLDQGIADVPRPWTRIAAGRPVCTVLAEAAGADACRVALAARAADIYRQLEQWHEEAA